MQTQFKIMDKPRVLSSLEYKAQALPLSQLIGGINKNGRGRNAAAKIHNEISAKPRMKFRSRSRRWRSDSQR